eukprot:757734-Hanusia_phi.AAC.2
MQTRGQKKTRQGKTKQRPDEATNKDSRREMRKGKEGRQNLSGGFERVRAAKRELAWQGDPRNSPLISPL